MCEKTDNQINAKCLVTSDSVTVYHLRTDAAGRRLDVTKAPYNAVGNGKAMDTQAIQKAVDDCNMGDVVYLPAGIYRTGALRLHSNMELYLEEGATLQGTDDPEDYLPRIFGEYEKPKTIPGRVRPRLINISNCKNVRISGLTLKDSASWNVHMIYSEKIVTDHCTFHSEDVWNGDGWDPEGNVIGRPTTNIKIFDCICAFAHGITIGSEMSSGVEDVKIWDCDMGNSLCGIEIKGTKKRGVYVRNVQVRDCKTARVLFHSVEYNDDGIGAKVSPLFEDCTFENVWITGKCLDHDGRITIGTAWN